jgi:hypothetical protein
MRPNIQLTGGTLAVIHARRKMASAANATRAAISGKTTPATETRLFDTHKSKSLVIPLNPDLSVPERGTTGPIPIGDVMEFLRRIIAHPDRGRLMAEFCKRHW